MGPVKKIRSAKQAARTRRKVSIRKRVSGTAERPRLSVFRSLRHIFVQAIDDTTNTVLAAASDVEPALKDAFPGKKKKDRAKVVGQTIAAKLRSKSIEKVVFDRSGYLYHGRVRAVADGAREGGLRF